MQAAPKRQPIVERCSTCYQPSSEKIVSIFEPHTDVIVKGFRDIQYGHKINLSTETRVLLYSVDH